MRPLPLPVKSLALPILLLAASCHHQTPAPAPRPAKTGDQAALDDLMTGLRQTSRYQLLRDDTGWTIFDTATADIWVMYPKMTNGWIKLPALPK